MKSQRITKVIRIHPLGTMNLEILVSQSVEIFYRAGKTVTCYCC